MRSPGEMGFRSDSIMQASQPTAQQVAKTLPYLRRYARALTGNQQSGDSFVQATLEAVVADPSLLNSELPPRVAVYLAFQRIFDRDRKSVVSGKSVSVSVDLGGRCIIKKKKSMYNSVQKRNDQIK